LRRAHEITTFEAKPKFMHRTRVPRFSRLLMLVVTLSGVAPALSASDGWTGAINLRTAVPLISARDQHGDARTLSNLMGKKGMLLVFNGRPTGAASASASSSNSRTQRPCLSRSASK
jgi:hypothetical protein